MNKIILGEDKEGEFILFQSSVYGNKKQRIIQGTIKNLIDVLKDDGMFKFEVQQIGSINIITDGECK